MMVSKACVMDVASLWGTTGATDHARIEARRLGRAKGRLAASMAGRCLPWHNCGGYHNGWHDEVPGGVDMSSHLRGFGILLRTLLAIVASAATATFDIARADYPEKQITLIVCFPAGGGTDIAARLINTLLSEALGKPVIVENRAGAGGNIGIAAAARAAPDGYTLLVCSSAFVVNPSLYAQAAYDPLKDFSPVMVIGASPNVFVLPAQSELKSMPDLIAKGKANPGKLNWTSPGAGTTPQLGEILKLRTGVDMVHIPFTGAGPAMTAVLGGQVDMYTANLGSVAALIDGGKVRPIAMTSEKRWPELPNVPTLEELGVNDAVSDTFQGIYAPVGTPQPIIDRLVKELTAILQRPDIRERFAKAGLPVVADGPAAFRARIAREVPLYKEVIDKAGLKIQ
jgi:tripartite-type tricarboxylate transporter receptor subunit TctC